ncbi:MAG: glycosyltransferase [Treponemataceae bacterium]|nr:MAG: glycosyltransferase [Treponemataceae bacterium]
MKLFLATRGTQGDVYPYLGLANTLVQGGYEVTISLPKEFAKHAESLKLNYLVQEKDDITGMIDDYDETKDLLKWMRRVIDEQFEEYIPVVQQHDIFLAANTEFAAPHIAEYCKKPCIRTGYAPLLPSKKIFPPVFTILNPPVFLPPPLAWGALNAGLDLMIVKTVNANRKKLGMRSIKSQGEYAPSHSDNFLMYSPTLGEVDHAWPYRWHAGGYCFNDILPYDKAVFENLKKFVQKDTRPTVFFTLGSCTHKKRDEICSWLLDICTKNNYKLVVGAGWWKTGKDLKSDTVFVQDSYLPHSMVFPLFDAIIHHGGSGTTHSAARAGKPQLILPILLDQFYYGRRIKALGVSPGSPKNFGEVTCKMLEKKVVDLVENKHYRENAATLAKGIASEEGLDAMFAYIERVAATYGEKGYN